jgi:hypothetical protein
MHPLVEHDRGTAFALVDLDGASVDGIRGDDDSGHNSLLRDWGHVLPSTLLHFASQARLKIRYQAQEIAVRGG